MYKPTMLMPIKMVIENFETCKNTIKPIDFSNNDFILKKIKSSKPIT
jgi:hypothetical protein